MKINPKKPPRAIQVVKNFYCYNENTVYIFDSDDKVYSIVDFDSKENTARFDSIISLDLINVIKNGFIKEYELSEEEIFKIEFDKAANRADKDSYSTKGAFRLGANWMREYLNKTK